MKFMLNVGALLIFFTVRTTEKSLSPSDSLHIQIHFTTHPKLQMLTLILDIYLELVQYQIPLHLKVKNLINLSYLDVFPLDPIE